MSDEQRRESALPTDGDVAAETPDDSAPVGTASDEGGAWLPEDTEHVPPAYLIEDDAEPLVYTHEVDDGIPRDVVPDAYRADDDAGAVFVDDLEDTSAVVVDDEPTVELDDTRELTEVLEPPAPEVSAVSLPPRSFGRRLIDAILGRPSTYELERRLNSLNRAISAYPDSPANYVLRGELYLSLGGIAFAVADFRQALALAETEVQTSDWGVVAQAMQDRALKGLAAALGQHRPPPPQA